MHLKDLKRKRIGELTQIAKEMNIENAAGLRKQELIFSILQALVDKMSQSMVKAFWKSFQRVLVFLDQPTLTICRGRMISIFLPPR